MRLHLGPHEDKDEEIMASRNIDLLVPSFRYLVREMLKRVEDKGFELLVYCTLRSPYEQARLYRQSRTRSELETKAELFRLRGFDYLADILIQVGPQQGKLGWHVTHAGPGESWHQYGRAIDAVPLREGKALWDDDAPQWQVYGEAAKDVGLHWSGNWQRFRELPHTQDTVGNPLSTLGMDGAAELLRRYFGKEDS